MQERFNLKTFPRLTRNKLIQSYNIKSERKEKDCKKKKGKTTDDKNYRLTRLPAAMFSLKIERKYSCMERKESV